MLFGLGLFLVATPFELAPKTGPEALLGLLFLIAGGGHLELEYRHQVEHRGPRMTMNIAGKMKITVGKSILIGDFIAFSSAAA